MKQFIIVVIILFNVVACQQQKKSLVSKNTNDAIIFTINSKIKHQTIDNFSASDCWGDSSMGYGKMKKEAMADWLFSMDTLPNGSPKGIGLSAWRFNIGAGSAEQGTESQIKTEWRRAECFLQQDGTYNWYKHKGQRWFLQAAKKRGVNKFIGFCNSPPVYFTKNGLAHGTDKENPSNISIEQMSDFAQFLVEVTKGIKQHEGIEFAYIAPVNEPQWDWTGDSQEGCYFTNDEFAHLINELDKRIQKEELTSKILITEAAAWEALYAYEDNPAGNQIPYFFGKDSPVKKAKSLPPIIAGHSYFTTVPVDRMIGVRDSVNMFAQKYGVDVWQTEYCVLGDDDLKALEWKRMHKDVTMNLALYVNRIIHYDLTVANVSAWQWWLAISYSDYPDGLIYTDDNKKDGNYEASKLMWVLGNYSRFVRQGAKRIEIAAAEKVDNELLISAYYHKESKQLTVVASNISDKNKTIRLEAQDLNIKYFVPYVTNDEADNNLTRFENMMANTSIEIPAKTVVTFAGKVE